MSRTRIYRNDRQALFEPDADPLERFDPGIVLLYADTGESTMYAYFEGRLGHPIQATVEHDFDGQIRPGALRDVVRTAAPERLQVADAPAADPESLRWALDGLAQEPLTIADPTREMIGRLVDRQQSQSDASARRRSAWERSSDDRSAGLQLDFAVKTVRDGARLVSHLIERLQGDDVTIALSMSGRISELEATDIVVHVDETSVKSGRRITALAETRDRIDSVRQRVAEEHLESEISTHVDGLWEVYRDAVRDSDVVSEDAAADVVRRSLERRFEGIRGLSVVAPHRVRRRLVVAALVGFGLGTTMWVAVPDDVPAVLRSVFARVAPPTSAQHLLPFSSGGGPTPLAMVATAASILALARVGLPWFDPANLRRKLGGEAARRRLLAALVSLLAMASLAGAVAVLVSQSP